MLNALKNASPMFKFSQALNQVFDMRNALLLVWIYSPWDIAKLVVAVFCLGIPKFSPNFLCSSQKTLITINKRLCTLTYFGHVWLVVTVELSNLSLRQWLCNHCRSFVSFRVLQIASSAKFLEVQQVQQHQALQLLQFFHHCNLFCSRTPCKGYASMSICLSLRDAVSEMFFN